jgi:hypothetical protein
VHDSERRLKSVSANAAPIASYGMTGWGGVSGKALPDGTHRKYVYDLDGPIIVERDELKSGRARDDPPGWAPDGGTVTTFF